jgi:lysophospholipase L1-like esterase
MTDSGVRRLAAAAAYGGGGLSLLGGSLYGLIMAEVKFARHAIGIAEGDPPPSSGWYGHGRPGPAIKIALLGDSSAAGYGVDTVEETTGAHLASGIAEAADRRVYLTSVAKVGAQTKDLRHQIDRVLPVEPHVAVVFIGANDVTHRVSARSSERLLREAVARLKRSGVEVVVGTCPDLGTIEPLAPPLRQYASFMSRRLAEAQAKAVVECDGRSVALASILGEEFSSFSELLFGPDRFHPSAAGYARMTSAVLPTVLASLGLAEDEVPESVRGEGVLPLALAVHEAAQHPGASVEPVTAGATGGRTRFALLRRRRHQPQAEVTGPEDQEYTGQGASQIDGEDDAQADDPGAGAAEPATPTSQRPVPNTPDTPDGRTPNRPDPDRSVE